MIGGCSGQFNGFIDAETFLFTCSVSKTVWSLICSDSTPARVALGSTNEVSGKFTDSRAFSPGFVARQDLPEVSELNA